MNNQFQLNHQLPAVQNGKIFLVSRAELEGRLDAIFYGHEFNDFDKILSANPHKKFNQLYKYVFNGYDFRNYKEEGTPYIKVANIKQGEFDFRNLQYIDFDSSQISKNIQLKKGNLLLTRKGTFGNAIALDRDYDYVISSEVFYIEIKKDEINSKFLELFFNSRIGQAQFDKHKIGAIMGSLSQEALSNLKIPIPPIEIQQQIVQKMEVAYTAKREKEAEAAQLLASIDSYLLAALGITLPDVKEKQKTFFVELDKVSGGRFDPKLYLPSSRALLDSLYHSKYEHKALKDLITHSASGDWGIETNAEGYEECLVIRATEFDNRYNLKLENNRVKYRFISKLKLQKLAVEINDLLIEKSGGSIDQPVGRIAIITKDIQANHKLAYSNFVHKIRLTNAINSEYVYYFLKTLHNIKITDLMQSQTNGIRNLIMQEYVNIPIPIPSSTIQTEIVSHISQIRKEAQQLEAEAKAAVEKAKKEVEIMILGEGGAI